MLLNYGVGEDSWESIGQQEVPVSPSWRKSVLNIHWKDWHWSWNFNTLATWCKELTLWKRSLCWERLKAEGEGDNGGWDVWMASLTQWIWVWVSSRRWWWTGKPGVLQSIGLQRVWHNWATELSWTFFSLWLDNVITWTNSYNWEEPSTLALTLALMREGCRLLPKSYSWSFINKTGLSLPLHL